MTEHSLAEVNETEGGRTVQKDVLEVEKDCICQRTRIPPTLSHVGYGKKHDAIHHRVVLKVNVI